MSCKAVISGSDGASRMSSVFGLKVRPSSDTVLPRTSPLSAAETLRDIARLRASLTGTDHSLRRRGAVPRVVHGHPRLDDAEWLLVVLAGLEQRQRVLGEARAAIT